ELKAHAEAHGAAPLWAEAYQNKGAGTGAIGFKTSEEAEEALAVLNGTVFKKVQIATDPWDAKRK
ncbi:Ttc28, partial [Symbiodinium sp. CCMP2456]